MGNRKYNNDYNQTYTNQISAWNNAILLPKKWNVLMVWKKEITPNVHLF